MTNFGLDELRDAADAAVRETAARPWEAVRAQCMLLAENRQLRQRVQDLAQELDLAVEMLMSNLERPVA